MLPLCFPYISTHVSLSTFLQKGSDNAYHKGLRTMSVNLKPISKCQMPLSLPSFLWGCFYTVSTSPLSYFIMIWIIAGGTWHVHLWLDLGVGASVFESWMWLAGSQFLYNIILSFFFFKDPWMPSVIRSVISAFHYWYSNLGNMGLSMSND